MTHLSAYQRADPGELGGLPVGPRDGLHPPLSEFRLLGDVVGSDPGRVGTLGAVPGLAAGGNAGHLGFSRSVSSKNTFLILSQNEGN